MESKIENSEISYSATKRKIRNITLSIIFPDFYTSSVFNSLSTAITFAPKSKSFFVDSPTLNR